jgi:hypothetical protein
VGIELELATNEELIRELCSRSTFQGIVIYSKESCKKPDWKEKRKFAVRLNANLDNETAVSLLRQMAIAIEEKTS